MNIPVIDLFAGPGGLGEGFSAYQNGRYKNSTPFRIALSIEKDPAAYKTLLLRSFFRQFQKKDVPLEYYAYLAERISRDDLFRRYPGEAKAATREAWLAELGHERHVEVVKRIRRSLSGRKRWVLVGGPPCQAYSIVGRARMRGSRKDFEADERHVLYKEYLKILADLQPPVFLFENVPGILSSTLGAQRIFRQIFRDMSDPCAAIRTGNVRCSYRIYSLVKKRNSNSDYVPPEPSEFIVKAEEYGVPQTRHRVFLLGVRSDISTVPLVLRRKRAPSVREVIDDLPAIRSGLSREEDSHEEWWKAVVQIKKHAWCRNGNETVFADVVPVILRTIRNIEKRPFGLGGNYLPYNGKPRSYANWYLDRRNRGVCNHSGRFHMQSDLHRYLFAAAFAMRRKRSPKLREFPEDLLPLHKNTHLAMGTDMFSDRFRVQVSTLPSTTVTAHISKDGHSFIHYDPVQCRSLTVREAARLQMFPDNYRFEGPRTEQYRQVGNAVPPYLARHIAAIVHKILISVGE